MLLCGFTGVSGRDAAWALAAMRQARAFAAAPVLCWLPEVVGPHTTAAEVHLASARVSSAFNWKPLLAMPSGVAAPSLMPAPPAVTSTIRYAPRSGFASRMVGGQFQGSVDGINYTTLSTIRAAPLSGHWTTVSLPLNLTQYRYLRYLAPNAAYGNIAELEFDSGSGTSLVKLTGTGFGTAGSWRNDGNTFAKALDGGLGTFFDAPAPGNGDFVGIDRGASAFTVAARPATITGTTTSLSVRRTVNTGAASSYAWSATGPATVTFSGGGSPSATATFRQPGTYSITARCVTGSPYSSSVAVTVLQTLTSLRVSPASASMTVGGTQQFSAAAADQFGGPLSAAPRFSVSGGGTVSAAGLFTAGTAGQSFIVTASSGAISGRAAVSVTPAPVPVAVQGPVQLPIEVMGADGTTASVQVSVPASAPVTGLWMEVHNLSYPDKASVQVNGGAWVPLDNGTVQVADPGKSYGGIGGGFSTLKMTLPLPAGAMRDGTNTVSFRFNHTDGVSSGFRVLAFNFVDADGQPVLPASAFVQDDPDTWQAPLTDVQDIAAGQSLWQSGHLLQSSISLSPIKAACADCHTDDGRDLKYFNYSNYSIIQRAEFHGMSAAQGAQIASYIRTLNVPNPGRPWNPPYQPGPGLDSQPVQNWAAGAGVNAVLTKSSDMLPYIFPSGMVNGHYNPEDIAATKNLNVRELPIAMQLPDWNHWLPPVWPGDIPGSGFTTSLALARYNGNVPGYNSYNSLAIAAMAQADPTPQSLDTLRQVLDAWSYSVGQLQQTAAVNPAYGTGAGVGVGGGIGPGGVPLTTQAATNLYSVGLWSLAKKWGLMQKYDLEEMGQALYGPTAANGAPVEKRQWVSGATFEVSPAFDGVYGDAPNGTGGQAARAWAVSHPAAFPIDPNPLRLSPLVPGTNILYESLGSDWYYLQMILNAGNRHRGGNDPIDWGYFPGPISSLAGASGVTDVGRIVAIRVKQMQQFNNGYAPDQPNAGVFGWETRETAIGDLALPTYTSWADTPPSTQAAIDDAYLSAWLSAAEQYTPAQYWAEGELSPAITNADIGTGYINSQTEAPALYASVPLMDRMGVDPAVMNRYVGWLQGVLPNVDWANDR